MTKLGVCKFCHRGIRSKDQVCPHCRASDPFRDIESEVRPLIIQGNKVEAIKRVIELTGFGLKESKDYVDSLI